MIDQDTKTFDLASLQLPTQDPMKFIVIVHFSKQWAQTGAGRKTGRWNPRNSYTPRDMDKKHEADYQGINTEVDLGAKAL